MWMFGIVDTSQTRYMEVVQTRDAATLLPIIRAHVAPQSRAIDQSDYRIAGGLFFIDTSFQVSNGVCRWSTANSPYKMAQKSLSAQTDRFRVR